MRIKVRAVALNEKRTMQGIHLIDPDTLEIEDAREDAERDLFEVIWCHYSNVEHVEFKKRATKKSAVK